MQAREAAPGFRFVKAGGQGLSLHRLAGRFQRDEGGEGRSFPLQRAAQVTDIAAVHAAGLDLDEGAFGCAAIAEEMDHAIDAAVGAAFAPAGAAGRAERLGADEGERPPLELVAVFGGELPGAGQRAGLADDLIIAAGEELVAVAQAVFHEGDGEVGDVDAGPAAAEGVGGVDGGAAAAERVEDETIRRTGSADEFLYQGARLLSLEAQVLAALLVVIGETAGFQQQILGGVARVGGGVTLQAGPLAAFGVVDQASGIQRFEPFVHAGDRAVAEDEMALDVFGVFARFRHRPTTAQRIHIVLTPRQCAWAAALSVVQWSCQISRAITPSLVLRRVGGRQLLLGFGRGDVVAVPIRLVGARIEQDVVLDAAEAPRVVVGDGAFPVEVVAIVLGAEDGIQDEFEVVRGGVVAMQIKAAAGFEDAVQLDQAGGHHHQIGADLVGAAERLDEGGEHAGDARRCAAQQLAIELFRAAPPMPAVFEGGDLRFGIAPALVFEEDVVGAVGVEGRVEVDEVDGGAGEVIAEDGEVVAVVEGVGGHLGLARGTSRSINCLL